MKANSRRRVLISSLAMLLVAIVALGTATYAWFTSSTVATANGINVRTAKASKLEISKSDLAWGTLVDYDVDNKLLLPASSGNGTAWFKADAADKSAFTAKTDTIASIAAGDLGNYVVMDQLNIHNAGEATVENVEIKFSVPNNYLRVALVEATEGGTGKALKGTFANGVYADDTTAYVGLTATDGTGNSITPKNEYTIEVGTLEKDDVVYYNLYVWFEGQDVDCKDANAGVTVSDIEFTVTGDTKVE
ncbi:MAG: hypothetical protein E7532_05990 [Ruminococcaceae bacterium]|nr:hypothetical protein [Oscillospiraceae bacterium]